MKVPVLTWHAMNVSGSGYVENDHVAFREDLEWLHGAGLRIVSLHQIATALRAGRLDALEGGHAAGPRRAARIITPVAAWPTPKMTERHGVQPKA